MPPSGHRRLLRASQPGISAILNVLRWHNTPTNIRYGYRIHKLYWVRKRSRPTLKLVLLFYRDRPITADGDTHLAAIESLVGKLLSGTFP
jgi:hypothetical protein